MAVLEKGWYRCSNKAKDEETGEYVCPNARKAFEVKTSDPESDDAVGHLCGCEHRFVPAKKT